MVMSLNFNMSLCPITLLNSILSCNHFSDDSLDLSRYIVIDLQIRITFPLVFMVLLDNISLNGIVVGKMITLTVTWQDGSCPARSGKIGSQCSLLCVMSSTLYFKNKNRHCIKCLI